MSKLLLALVMARALDPSDLGTYGLVVAVLSIGVVMVGLELYTQANRDMVPLGPSQRARMIRDQFAFYLVTYLLAGVGIAVAVVLDLLAFTTGVIVLLLLVLDHLAQELFRVLVYLSRTDWANIVFFFRAGAWAFVVAAAFALVPDMQSLGTVFGLWAAGAAIAVALALYGLRDLPWREALRSSTSRSWMRRSLIAALPFMISAAAALVAVYGDRLFIDAFAGREAVGIYTLFSGFALAVPSLVTAMVSHQFLPRVVRAMDQGWPAAIGVLRQFALANLAVTGMGIACALILVHPALWIIGREEYSVNVTLFFWLVPAMSLRALSDVPAAALYGVRADRMLLGTNLLSVFTALICNALLVPIHGATGAAYATLAASLVLLASQALFGYLALKRLRSGGIAGKITAPHP